MNCIGILSIIKLDHQNKCNQGQGTTSLQTPLQTSSLTCSKIKSICRNLCSASDNFPAAVTDGNNFCNVFAMLMGKGRELIDGDKSPFNVGE